MISIIDTYGSMLLAALGQTCLLAFLSLIFACILGLVFGLMNVSRSKVLRIIGGIYVDAIRGVPLIVLAYFIYFGVPYAVKALGFTDFRLTALYAGTITLALNCGAYMAEILRAGIQSVDRGQMEAARSLGMSYGHSMRKVVLPQAIRTMIPSIINQFIITLKDTSILSVIGFPELVNTGKTVVANTMNAFGTWAVVGIMYMIVIISLSKIARQIERRVTNGR